jgi:hypothetical protein
MDFPPTMTVRRSFRRFRLRPANRHTDRTALFVPAGRTPQPVHGSGRQPRPHGILMQACPLLVDLLFRVDVTWVIPGLPDRLIGREGLRCRRFVAGEWLGLLQKTLPSGRCADGDLRTQFARGSRWRALLSLERPRRLRGVGATRDRNEITSAACP